MEPLHQPEFMQSVLASLGEGVIVYDRELRYRFWNPAMERMTGLRQAQVLGRPALEVFPYLRAHGIDQLLARALAGETVQGPDIPYRVPETGREGWQAGSFRPHCNQTGRIVGVVGLIRDITDRRRAEDELRRATAEWEQTFDSVPDAIAILDEEQRILRVNRAMAIRLGLPPSDCVGRTCYELIHGRPEPPSYCPHTAMCRDGREHTAEIHEPRLGGDFLVSTTPRVDAQGTRVGAVHVARDLSEQKRAEADRRALALFPAQNPSPVLRLGDDGTVLYANEASWPLLLMWGCTVGARLAPPAYEVLVEAPLVARTPREVEVPCGERIYSVVCVPFGVEGYVNLYGRDVTARHRAEQALAAQKALLEAVVEQAADPIFVVDPTAVITRANSAMRRFHGGDPRGQSLAACLETLGPSTDRRGRPIPYDERATVRALRGETVVGQHRVVQRHGARSEYLVSAAPIRGEGGAILGAVGMLTDVTAEKAVEAQLRAALAEKDAALATNVTLLREVHHRVKNNLQMLCDLLYLQMEGLEHPEQHADLKDAYGRLYAFARLHEQLYQSMRSGEVRLRDYFRKLAEGFGTLYPTVTVRLDVPPEPIYLDVDRAVHIGLVANELVTNAAKHAFPAGTPGEVIIRWKRAGEHLQLEVQDNGAGLPPTIDLDQAKTLGLRIVRVLAQRLKGTVTVEADGGTRFTLTFPVYAEAPVEPKAE